VSTATDVRTGRAAPWIVIAATVVLGAGLQAASAVPGLGTASTPWFAVQAVGSFVVLVAEICLLAWAAAAVARRARLGRVPVTLVMWAAAAVLVVIAVGVVLPLAVPLALVVPALRASRCCRRGAGRVAGLPGVRPLTRARGRRDDRRRRPRGAHLGGRPGLGLLPHRCARGPRDVAVVRRGRSPPAGLVDEAQHPPPAHRTPIQTATLPDSLAGRDVLGRGRTGSGKTYAFLLPLVARLSVGDSSAKRGAPRALILAPTRELVGQIHAAWLRWRGPTTSPRPPSSVASPEPAGGGAQGSGTDIVVACPGRLEDLIKQGHAHLDDVEITVIDEADHMADLGFLPAVKRILDLPRRPNGQRMLFSATLDNGVDVLVRATCTTPVHHSVDSTPVAEPDDDHHVLTRERPRPRVLSGHRARLGPAAGLFTRTKHHAPSKLARS
jgi:hypothetical protein